MSIVTLSPKYFTLGYYQFSFTSYMAFRTFTLFATFTTASIVHDLQ